MVSSSSSEDSFLEEDCTMLAVIIRRIAWMSHVGQGYHSQSFFTGVILQFEMMSLSSEASCTAAMYIMSFGQ